MSEDLRKYVDEHLAVARAVRETLLPLVEQAGRTIIEVLGSGAQVLVFGNGGSAADAQHFAAELVGGVRQRQALRAVALTTDTSALTSIGNDYTFDHIFSRQVEALARPGDVAVGITTSGNSKNVIAGLIEAKRHGAVTIALLGGDGGRAKVEADQAIIVPSSVTARVQEMHILIIHMICEQVDGWAATG